MKLGIFLLSIFISTMGSSQIKYSRMEDHLPDWLWKNEKYNVIVDSNSKREIAFKVSTLSNLSYEKFPDQHWALEKEVANSIANKFALVDLEKDASIVENSKINLALQIDPYFDERSRNTIKKAAQIFIDIALDDAVISEAMNSSIDKPTPFPEMYSKYNQQNWEENVYSDEYELYFLSRSKPRNVESFKKQLKQALSVENGDPAFLVITAYDNDVWWGRAYINFYYRNFQQLSRLSPAHGYLNIGFNVDSLKARQDPTFWASKVAHECLHNIGYWHPGYNNVAERNENNRGNQQAFIVAYERAILKKAKSLYAKQRSSSSSR